MKILILILAIVLVSKFVIANTNTTVRETPIFPPSAAAKTFSIQLLTITKTANSKLQSKQDSSTELKAIIDSKKTVETARLKAAMEFTKQQAALTDKTALEALETRRKAVSERFNELLRLIDQVEKNQKTALLPEKLNELIVFLEPAASADAKAEAAKAPPKPLLRGAALTKEKATMPVSAKKQPSLSP